MNRVNSSSAALVYSFGLAGVDQSMNFLFADAIIISFCAVLGITIIYRLTTRINSYLRLLFTMSGTTDQRYWSHNHGNLWPKVKKHLLYAPLGRQQHNREIMLSRTHHIDMGTLPGRYMSILISMYVLSNLAYCLALSWHRKESSSVIAELRGRTGVLAIVNLIPTVLFALRNNPLIPLLGVSYDTFNLMHRWCARLVIIQSVLHTICWAVNAIRAGGMEHVRVELATSSSYAGGMVGTVLFGTILIAAWSPVRHAFYETFINGHRIMVAIGLAGIWVHLDHANLPQFPYVAFCVGIWALELVWRTGRIVAYNYSRRRGVTKVTVEALSAEACRVTFNLRRPWRYQPGCHVHAYLPTYALWSSHPFSIAWAENANTAIMTDTEMEKHTDVDVVQPAVTSISLIIRARDGMTRKLYDKASARPNGRLTTWGAIEGPYGGHSPMTSYGTAILFAGGVGITHCMGYVHHLVRQYQLGTSSTQKVLLVWSVPNTEALEWVRPWMDTILRMEGRRDVLRIQLFVTKPRHRGEVISSTGSVQLHPGRCNPTTILEKEMRERIGAVGVTVCGPGAFADSVRAAVRDVVTDGFIDFMEEAFTY
ncbi:putative FRE ferric reductase-like transmembrane component [Piedraia hortae CBS 480.64]|uniref:Putative FRE ferric reductase-like transmembrane component n=1 Tax=Piedraia hortae CBS 480.64 TaxID=1314780 RepID=A0A6A7BT40_9PEZI|nr:putative FRE ferric reductase-like transmembrane component [Piedraia hortae CBS 480.64]